MDDPSPDSRKAQVKELEQIVKKLQQENEQLLNKVSTSNLAPQLKPVESDEIALLADDNLEDSLLNLEDINPSTHSEGEWLYVSPRLALTPAQKKQAPLQWLSEGHAQRLGDLDIPSLDEVRKTLVFNMEEAETISQTAHSRPNQSNSKPNKFPSRVRERPSNSPNQQNGDDFERSRSDELNIKTDNGDNIVPVIKWKAKMPQEENEDVPVVKWKAKMPQEENEDVPVVKWKAKMPQEENEDVPVVKWKAKMPQEENEDVPVVKWKAKMPQEENEDVPVVKWKAKMPQEENEDVPVVKWKAKMPQEENEDVPVVKWKAKMPQEENEDVPVVKWKPAKMPQEENENVPVVKWKAAKMPQEENENVPVVKRKARVPQNSTQPRPQGQNRAPPRSTVKRTEAAPTSSEVIHSEESDLNRSSEFEKRNLKAPSQNGLRQPHSPSQSPARFQGRLEAGRGLKKPSGQSLRHRSPSPPTGGKRQLARPTASSPSRRSSSPGKSKLGHPGGSPNAARRQLQGPGSPSLAKHPTGLPTGPKRQDGGQRMSRLQAHNEGQQVVTPPQNGGIKTPSSSGIRGLSPLGSGKRGLTPPKGTTGVKPPRRILPSTPSSAPQRSQQPGAEKEADGWLEGCF